MKDKQKERMDLPFSICFNFAIVAYLDSHKKPSISVILQIEPREHSSTCFKFSKFKSVQGAHDSHDDFYRDELMTSLTLSQG